MELIVRTEVLGREQRPLSSNNQVMYMSKSCVEEEFGLWAADLWQAIIIGAGRRALGYHQPLLAPIKTAPYEP